MKYKFSSSFMMWYKDCPRLIKQKLEVYIKISNIIRRQGNRKHRTNSKKKKSKEKI